MRRRWKNKISKTKALRIHAKKRAKQRYGVNLNSKDLRQITGKIQSGHSVALGAHTLRVSEHLVEYQGVTYRVLYDKQRKGIITFLPKKEKRTC